MAKASVLTKKKAVETPKKVPAKKKRTPSASISIDKVNEQALALLQKLDIEERLRNDIEWCLGSYWHDHNATGLLETAKRALDKLKEARTKSAKAVPVKAISDLEKVLK